MTEEQILRYVQKAADEAATVSKKDQFRHFARNLPTAVLNRLMPPEFREEPDPTRYPSNERILLWQVSEILKKMMRLDRSKCLNEFQLGLALSLEGMRRDNPTLDVYVPVDPFDDSETDKGMQSVSALIRRREESRNRFEPRKSLSPEKLFGKVRLFLLLLIGFGVLLLVWNLVRR